MLTAEPPDIDNAGKGGSTQIIEDDDSTAETEPTIQLPVPRSRSTRFCRGDGSEGTQAGQGCKAGVENGERKGTVPSLQS